MAKIRKQQKIDRSVLDLAYERIHRAFDLYDTVMVSFSGGKDSTACLNLTVEVARERNRLPVRVVFCDEEAIPYQTEEYVRRVSQLPDVALEWYCLPVKHRNACSRQFPWWSPWDPQEEENWVRPLPPEAITSLAGFRTDGGPRDRLTWPEAVGLLCNPERDGTCGMVMGIRAQESMTRRRAVSIRTQEQENYLIHWTDGTSKGNIWKVYPIYDWLTEDVWTAPALFGWDYNRAYDVMDACGIPHPQQRCSPAYGEEPMQGFFRFKSCFPEIWDKMSVRVPGANAALLYARTDLWGYGGVPEKPDDLSWEAFIVGYVTKFAPEELPLVAGNVRSIISDHYGKTADPILSEVDHPLTGVSWRRILSVAMRGDFKQRRSRTMTTNSLQGTGKDPSSVWQQYHEARQREGL